MTNEIAEKITKVEILIELREALIKNQSILNHLGPSYVDFYENLEDAIQAGYAEMGIYALDHHPEIFKK